MKRGDDGVTLLELLVCMALSSIIIAALAAGFFASTRAIDVSSDRMADTHDAQMASRFFTTDVQSANRITKSSAFACGSGSPLITFAWFGWTGSNHAVIKFASYFVQNQDGEQQLIRSFCSGGGAASTVVIAHNLAGSPTVTCFLPSGDENPDCSDRSVATAQLTGTAQSGSTDTSSFSYVLRATRRAP
jgi:prepilin-type N-terminal cleavage/methylation domain-containing protein